MKTFTTYELANLYISMDAERVAEFISASFPEDAKWIQPQFDININWIGWSTTHIGNKTVSIMYRNNGIFLDIIGDTFRPDTVYFNEYISEVDGKTCYYLDVDNSCDTNIIEQSKLDDIVRATRRMIWSTWYSNESGRLIPVDKFIVRHRKSDNKLHFYDKKGNWLRTSTEVVSTERYANGYVRYVTKSGRIYNLTTI
jgi:hypothetical protein